jgi:hypothetical protein
VKFKENFVANYSGSQFQAQHTSIHLQESQVFCHFWTRIVLKQHHLLTEEKLNETEARLEHTSYKSRKYLAQETGISKPPTAKVTKLYKLWSCKANVDHAM